ncbi:MAG: 6-phosphogluconolactonase [Sumerlaeia bacterium]
MIHSFHTIDALAEHAKNQILNAAREAIAERGVFHWVLAGGSTPKLIFPALAKDAAFARLADRIHVWWGDERSVPNDHPDSNVRMAEEYLLANLQMNPDSIHRINGGAKDLVAEAKRYEQEILRLVHANDEGIPAFDFIMLGMGTDGHTASLFPDTTALNVTTHLYVANKVPQLSTHRLTLTYPAINAAAFVQIIATGAAKAGVLGKIFNLGTGEFPIENLEGNLHWLCDEAALAEVQ